MSAPIQATTIAEIAKAEGVTYDACLKAAWLITERVTEALVELEDFRKTFRKFANDEELGPILRDAAGAAWAMEMFTSVQWGQIPAWASTGVWLMPESEVKSC